MKLAYETYLDKVYGGWLGKCLGGAAGAPVEGYKKVIEYKHYSEVFRTDLPNDDLDLQLLWLEVLQKKGFSITAEDLAEAWERQCWYPFSEYGIFLKNYERGILPPYSGKFNNQLFCEGEGSPIRSEIWGMTFPGRPDIAAYYAEMDSSLDHSGASLWIEQYYAAIEADAFFETDVIKLLKNNIHYLPEGSVPRTCVEDVMACYFNKNKGWESARTVMMRRYAHNDFTNAITNLGIVVIALLYGENNLDEIINIAFKCGYDTDCTCATAGAIYGIVLGASNIDEKLKAMVDDKFVVGIEVESTNDSIAVLAQETCALGVKAMEIGSAVITDLPSDITFPIMEKAHKPVEIKIDYVGKPAIGYEDSCAFEVTVINHTNDNLSDDLLFEQLPTGWDIDYKAVTLTVPAQEKRVIANCIYTGKKVNAIANTNLIKATFAGCTRTFGIAGASIWQAVGPYIEALDKEDRPGIPSAHGEGCVLPTLESMVNNAAYLEKEYIDEKDFVTAFNEDEAVTINAYEDLLPLDQVFTFKGQGCMYLSQTVISPEDREAWFVIGNNDGFKLWVNDEEIMERDEIRLWTPYNNYETVKLHKGENKIVLKLLRRTESLKFSFGIRKYEGAHFHHKRWYVDFISLKK